MTITRVGTNDHYADGWDLAFGKPEKSKTKKTAVAKKAKKPAKKKAKKK